MVSTALDSPYGMPMDDDARLVERHFAGDPTAFDALYRRYYDKVFAIARGVLLDTEEALDATMEIFSLVYRNLHKFDRRSRFGTWLFRVAVNRSIQHSRSAWRRKKHVELTETIPAETPTPNEHEMDEKVERALSELSPSDRAILALFYWDELSLNEIAESLGCGVNAAKTRLYRARERFRAIYEAEESA
ncbi:MAG: RNA polymerase sigma factor [Fimbriimonadaceae bacterium]